MGTPSKDNSTSPPLSLLLAGRIGHGKSSTGNSILGKREFTTSNSYKEVKIDSIKRALSQDKRIEVVDAFDIADDISENDEFVLKMLDKLFSLNHGGFSALLIVLKYGIQFTNQEQHAIKIIQSFLGQEVMGTHGIIVMTHGDNFELDFEDKDMCFENWCGEQKGDIGRLFEKTGGRKVLFDNKTKDGGKRNKQVDQLLEKVKEIEKSSGRITMPIALAIRKEMNELLEILEEKYREILEQLKKLREKLNSQENRTVIKKSDIEAYGKKIKLKIKHMEKLCKNVVDTIEGKTGTGWGDFLSGCKSTLSRSPNYQPHTENSNIATEKRPLEANNSGKSDNTTLRISPRNQPHTVPSNPDNEKKRPADANDSSNSDNNSLENRPTVPSDPDNTDIATGEKSTLEANGSSNFDNTGGENRPTVTNDSDNTHNAPGGKWPQEANHSSKPLPSNTDRGIPLIERQVKEDTHTVNDCSEDQGKQNKEENRSHVRNDPSNKDIFDIEMNELLETLEEKYREILEQLKKLREKLNSQETRTGIKNSDIKAYRTIIEMKIKHMEKLCKDVVDTIEGTGSWFWGFFQYAEKHQPHTIPSDPENTNIATGEKRPLDSKNSSNSSLENRSTVPSDPDNTDLATGEKSPQDANDSSNSDNTSLENRSTVPSDPDNTDLATGEKRPREANDSSNPDNTSLDDQ